MSEGKYTQIGGVIKQITGEYTQIGGVIKQITINALGIAGAIKQVSVGDKYIWACEQGSDRLYGIDDNQANLTGWPLYGGTIADPADVACDSDGNSYWACANNVYKYDIDGNQIWEYTGFTTPVMAICVDADGYVYAADFTGDVKCLDGNEQPLLPGGGANPAFTEWTQSIRIDPYNPFTSLAIDYSAGMLYGACYNGASEGRIYRFLKVNGNYAIIYTANATYGAVLGIGIDEGTPSLYIGTENGYLMKISTGGYVYWGDGGPLLGEIYTVRVGHGGFGYYVNGSQGDIGKFALSTGSDEWKDQPAGTSRGLAVDAFGNVYSSHGAYGSVNAVIRKNNASGVEQWTWQPYINSRWRGIAVSPGIKAAGF